jgi:hypothetical protein
MNTFWLKIAAGAVGILVIIVVIGMFTSGSTQKQSQPKQPEKTFYDQAKEDKEKFLAEPEPVEPAQSQQAQQQTQPAEPEQSTQTNEPEPDAQQVPAQVEQPKPRTLYFKPLSEIDDIEAQRLLNVAVPGRSIGRLPMTGYQLMVPNCREIIKKWPDSWYAYRAKQLLADLPPRYQTQYNVTKEEIDLNMYYKQRPGTQPYTMEGTPQ